MVNKITTPPTQNEVIDKINELVDDKQDAITSSNKLSASLVSGLATVATSGSYNDLSNKPTIPTVNNATITFTQGGTTKGTFTLNQSSDKVIALDAGSSSYTAGTGINITNDVISVEGVKDQRNKTTAIKTWTGTLAQYNAIATKDNNTLYNITDDNTAVAYQAYTKSEVDTLLNNKANINLSNVEIPHLISFETDGTQWCKTYSNGWREQFCVYSNVVSLNSFTGAEFTWRLYKPITTFVSGHATVGGNAGILAADVYSSDSTTEVKFWLHNANNDNISNATMIGKFYVEGWI